MDVKKLAKISLSCSDFDDVEINRVMQDKTSRKVFMDIRECYAVKETDKRLECIMEKVLIKTCLKETRDYYQCLQKNGKSQIMKCFPEIVLSQQCIGDELSNLILVAKGMN